MRTGRSVCLARKHVTHTKEGFVASIPTEDDAVGFARAGTEELKGRKLAEVKAGNLASPAEWSNLAVPGVRFNKRSQTRGQRSFKPGELIESFDRETIDDYIDVEIEEIVCVCESVPNYKREQLKVLRSMLSSG